MKLNRVSLLIGFVGIPISAELITKNIIHLTDQLQISSLGVQLSIIAITTSIPQLATCIIAARKNQGQLAIGTILGSNMFNLLAVLAFPGMINPSIIPAHVVWRDMPVMLALTSIIFLINYHSTQRKMIRWQGGLLIIIYVSYILTLIFNTVT